MIKKVIPFVLGFAIIFSVPLISFGAKLVPECNIIVNGVMTEPCDFNYLMTLINNIISFILITLATPIFALIIIYAGWLYLSSGGSSENVSKAIKPETKIIFLETPSNPLLRITDIKAVADIAKRKNILTIIDNTFMSPYFQKPLDLGIDISVHSATKFLGGHSDVVAGLAITKEEILGKKIFFIQNGFGGVLGPQDSFLLLRGIKTLRVRMEEQQTSAQKIAEKLQELDFVKKVFYPGLKEHTGYEIHKAQSTGSGCVLSFEVNDLDLAKKIMKNTIIWKTAVSLGGVESILSYPYRMSHYAIPKEEREKLGINDSILRLSVGLENTDDLIEDIINSVK